jgi:hypothetical protein
MRNYIASIISLLLALPARSQTFTPIEQKIGQLHISIDPRVELLCAIQVASSYKYINRSSDYSNSMADYFKPYASHSAVLMTDDLQNNKFFMLAAPVQFILNFSALPELKAPADYPKNLLKRAGSKETLDNYRTAIELFAKESNFAQFWARHETFYGQVLDATTSEIAGVDLVKIVEDYFQEKQNSYNIIISPLAYGSYTHKIEVNNNKYDIYSCNVTRDHKNGIPYIKRVVLLRNATHEFSHSFVDYLTARYEKRVLATESLIAPIKAPMERQFYGNWSTCINEHIVRAINIRIHELNWGEELSQKMLRDEKANQFIYIEPILDKLKEFETERDKNHITFSDFYPRFLDMFDRLKTATLTAIDPINLPEKTEQLR